MGKHIRKAMLFTGLTFLVNWSLVVLFLYDPALAKPAASEGP